MPVRSPSCSTSPSPRASTRPPSAASTCSAPCTGLEQPNGRFSDVSAVRRLLQHLRAVLRRSSACTGPARTVSADARGYLLAQQCPGGGFKLYMDDAGCTADADADPDATAMAVQALIAVGGAATEAGDGLDYLTRGRRARPVASVAAVPPQGVNANSTGLAGQAFLAGGRTAQARAAVGLPDRPAVRLRLPRVPARRDRLRPGGVRGDTDGRRERRARRPGPPLDRTGDSSRWPAHRWRP